MTEPAQDAAAKRKPGRPPKGEGKRQNYTFRMNEGTRRQLLKAAENAGRSMSEEIEHRVERSFSERDLVRDVMAGGSRKVAKLLEIVSMLGRIAQMRTGQNADDDFDTFEVILRSLYSYLEHKHAYPSMREWNASDRETIEGHIRAVAEFLERIFHDRDRASVKHDMSTYLGDGSDAGPHEAKVMESRADQGISV